MTTATAPYFHTASLKARFLDDLENAVEADRINIDQSFWLECLTRPARQGDPVLPRVDRLSVDAGVPTSFEFAAAMIFSHAEGDDSRVYLQTLLYGVERFDDRAALLAVLRMRFANGNTALTFEYEKVEGDCFEGQMLAIVDHQVARVAATTDTLYQLPSLRTALAASMQAQLRKALPGTALDVHSHVLQLVQVASGPSPEEVLTTQTLAGAALEAYLFPEMPKGVERRFLDASGEPVSANQAVSLDSALTASDRALETHFLAQLKTYWSAADGQYASRRQQLADDFSESFRQEAYRRFHDGTIKVRTFEDLEILLESPSLAIAVEAPLRVRRMSLGVGPDDEFPAKLVGTFLIEFIGDQRNEVLWFSPEHDLLRFSSRQALIDYLTRPDGRNQLKPCVSLNERDKLSGQGELHLRLDNISSPLFEDRVDSVIAWQERNVKYALSLSRRSDSLLVMFDDALDVRERLDPRQLQFTERRWAEQLPVDFNAIWLPANNDELVVRTASEVEEAAAPLVVEDPQPVVINPRLAGKAVLSPASALVLEEHPSWLEKLQLIDVQAKIIRLEQQGVQAYAAHALNRQLCVLSTSAVDARNIRVQWILPSSAVDADPAIEQAAVGEFASAGSMDLIDLLLERVSGRRSQRLPHDTRVLEVAAGSSDGWPVGHISKVLIEHVLERVASEFNEGYQQYVRKFYVNTLRRGDRQWWPGTTERAIREDMLRLGLAVKRRMSKDVADALNMVQQVLDRPLRSLRTSLGTAFTEVYSLTLKFGDAGAAPISNALVLMQPLKTDSRAMLWSSIYGWRGFPSSALLERSFIKWFSGRSRAQWLQLLSEEDRRKVARHLKTATNVITLQLDKVEGNVIDALQQSALVHLQDGIRQACDMARRNQVQAELFKDLSQAAELDAQLQVARDGIRLIIDNELLSAMLPEWMLAATLTELDTYAGILHDYSLVSAAGEDYLFGVLTLQDFALQKLEVQLRKDFPDKTFKPDEITVTVRRYVPAPPGLGQTPSGALAAVAIQSETLTEYALNRFSGVQDASLSVTAKDDPEAHVLLTQAYLRKMTQEMDVGDQYRQLVDEKLGENGPDYPKRNRYFLELVPSMMLSVAFEDKLEKHLSAKAYSFIRAVVKMPDGLAREPVDGQAIIITPLQLRVNGSQQADRVYGVYLIGPRDPGTGPLILHATYHDGFVYKEYSDQAALLADIQSNKDLQKLILSRLSSEAVQSYGGGTFSKWLLSFASAAVESSSINTPGYIPVGVEGHIALDTPGMVSIAYDEIKGSALQFLFVDAIKVMRDIVRQQTITNAEFNANAYKFLLGEAVEQALMFLPGKLGSLVAIWQSQSLLRASVDAVSNRKWGKALSEFVAALTVLASSRANEEEDPLNSDDADVGSGDDDDLAQTTFSWADTELTAPQKLALQAMEVKSVALADLRKDPLNSLYQDIRADRFYAAVAGKVYEVRRVEMAGQWMIVARDGKPGPRLKLDEHQRWQLDLSLGLRGGGGALRRLEAHTSRRSVAQVMTVDARGIPEIHLRYPDKAIAIRSAWLRSKLYLENCLDNLQVQPDTGAHHPEVLRTLREFFGVDKVDRHLLKKTEKAIRPVLRKLMNRSMSPYDSERYTIGTRVEGNESTMAFIIKDETLSQVYLTDLFFTVPEFELNQRSVDEGFDAIGHYGGAALIHELTHLISGTYDFAYLKVETPFPDMLMRDTPDGLAYRNRASYSRTHGLSKLTPKADLFSALKDPDSDEYEAILNLSECETLDEARGVFFRDEVIRGNILLSNADSVTLLIQTLGRYNYRAGR